MPGRSLARLAEDGLFLLNRLLPRCPDLLFYAKDLGAQAALLRLQGRERRTAGDLGAPPALPARARHLGLQAGNLFRNLTLLLLQAAQLFLQSLQGGAPSAAKPVSSAMVPPLQCARRDSNPQPSIPKTEALSIELQAHRQGHYSMVCGKGKHTGAQSLLLTPYTYPPRRPASSWV